MGARWKVGVVGVGIAGRARVRALKERDDVTIVGGHRGRFLESVGLQAWDDPRALAAESDLLLVCSPDALHEAHVRIGLEQDCHVAVEFPLVPPGPDAVPRMDALFALADAHGRTLHVEHIERLSGTTRVLEGALREDPPRAARVLVRRPMDPPLDAAVLGAALLPRLHRAQHLFGDFRRIDGAVTRGGRLQAEVDAGGIPVTVDLEVGPSLPRRIEIHVETVAGVRLSLEGRAVRRDGSPLPLPETAPLFATDLAQWLEQIQGAPSYVDRRTLRHVLDVTTRVVMGQTGPIPAR